MKKLRVLIIGMGGAISARKGTDGKWKYGEIPSKELISIIPGLENEFDIKTIDLFRMDSADMGTKHWLTLASTIYHKMKSFDGIVVTMGTDTMVFAAVAVSFLVQNQSIPIVFTGSLVEPAHMNTDARWNLRQAIMVAGTTDIAETLILVSGRIIRAVKAKKANASEFIMFYSYADNPLGRINSVIKIDKPYRKRGKREPKLFTKLDENVAIMKVYPGFDGNRIINEVNDGATGLVLEGYGMGNIPVVDTTITKAVKFANKKNVPLVITSQSSLGAYWKHLYNTEIGARLKGLKVIPCYDMTTETAYVKLMWVMGQTREYARIKSMMQHNYAGEISHPY